MSFQLSARGALVARFRPGSTGPPRAGGPAGRAGRDRRLAPDARRVVPLLRVDEARRRLRRPAPARRFPAAVGDGLPRRPAPRGGGRARGQGGDVPRGGARARARGGLPGQQAAVGLEHHRPPEAGGGGAHGRPLLRPRAREARRGHREADARREGLPVRERAPRGAAARRLGRAALVRDRGRPACAPAPHGVHGQPGVLGRRAAQAAEDARAPLLELRLADGSRRLRPAEMAGGRAAPARVLPRPRSRGGGARHADARLRGREDRVLPQEAREVGGRRAAGRGGRRVRDRDARLPRADGVRARTWCARCSR